jgi:hypothetical protein
MDKLLEIFAIVMFGFILAISVLVGLRLDDKAQDVQQDSWNISPLSSLSYQGEGEPEQFSSPTITTITTK